MFKNGTWINSSELRALLRTMVRNFQLDMLCSLCPLDLLVTLDAMCYVLALDHLGILVTLDILGSPVLL
jgi:hypothetical protein